MKRIAFWCFLGLAALRSAAPAARSVAVKACLPIWLWLAAFAAPVQSQSPAQSTAGLNPILPIVFEKATNFSASADVRIAFEGQDAILRMPMRFHYRDGWSRSEISMAAVQSRALTQDMVVQLREVGMDEVVTIAGPGGATNWVLYPHVRAWFDAGRTSQAAGLPSVPEPAWTREKTGEETVDSHPCHRFRLALPMSDGTGARTVDVWEAQDLDGFPVQVRMRQEGFKTELLVRYRDVKQAAPEPELFEVPMTYRRFENMEGVMEAAVKKLLDPQ